MNNLESAKNHLIERVQSVQSEALLEQVRLLLEECLLLADANSLPPVPPPLSEAEYQQIMARAEKNIAEGNYYTHEEVVEMMRQRFAS